MRPPIPWIPYSTLALLTFQCTEAAVDGTELTVTSTERDGQAVEDTAVIPVELPHTCYAKDFLWMILAGGTMSPLIL